MAEQCTPTTEDIREDYAWYKHADGMDQDEAAAQFDCWLREHDAALIESLAGMIRHKQHAESIRQMLMGEARERREGVS